MRDRFSTAIYCDFCGKGRNEVAHLVNSPTAHICGDCAELAVNIVGTRRATRVDNAEVGCLSPISAPIDYRVEAAALRQAISPHAYPAAGGGADIDNNATPVIEGTLRAIAMLATSLDRRRQNGATNG